MVNNSKKDLYPILWMFLALNYVCNDLFNIFSFPSHQYTPNQVSDLFNGQGFLYSFIIAMQIPLLMTLMQRFLPYTTNQLLNAIVAGCLFVVQLTIIATDHSNFNNVFFGIVVIFTTVFIVVKAITNLRESNSPVPYV